MTPGRGVAGVDRFQWARSVGEPDIGGPIDGRAGRHLSRRRFVSLAMYTSAAIVLSGARALPVLAAAQPVASVGQLECMPAVPSPEPPVEVIAYAALEQLHVRYRSDTSVEESS